MVLSGFAGLGMYLGTIVNLRVLGYGHPSYKHMNKTSLKVTLLRCIVTTLPVAPFISFVMIEDKNYSFYFTIFMVDFLMPFSMAFFYVAFANTIGTNLNIVNKPVRALKKDY